MKKVINWIFITLFFAMVLLPVILMNTEKNYVSEIDNRVLNEFPSPGDENFADGVER